MKASTRSCRALLGLAASALFFSAAQANTVCVNTAAALQSALTTWANMTDGGNMTIKLVQNTAQTPSYVIGFGVFSLPVDGTASLSLLGGYTSNCAARSVNPVNTIIDGQNAANVGLILSTQNDVTVEGITFTALPKSFTIYFDNYVNGSGHALTLRYNVFRDIHVVKGTQGDLRAGVQIAGYADSNGTDLHFQNNLVYDVNADSSLPAVLLEGSGDGVLSISSNTFAGTGNASAVLAVNFYNQGSGAAFLENNIIFNGTSTSLSFADGDVGPFAGYNLLGNTAANVAQGNNSFAASFDNVYGSPGFTSTSSHNYHLASNAFLSVNKGGSSAFNPDGLPGHDLDDGARVIGSTIDLGAYESGVDDLNNFTVTSTLDASHANASNVSCAVNSSTCTLREAIIEANANSGASKLSFNLPCQSLLTLDSALPDITSDVTIDGYTNPSATPNTASGAFNANLCIYLNGGGNVADGLHTSGSGRLTVRGLVFTGFSDAAIRLDSGSNHVIAGNWIGNVSFAVLNVNGIRLSGSSKNTQVGGFDDVAAYNLIGGNSSSGVYIDNSAGLNTVANNLIGLDSAGLPLSSAKNATGVLIFNSPANTLAYNTIANNSGSGISIAGAAAKNNIVQYNTIGYASADLSAASNGDPAVQLSFAASGNTIGASQSGSSGGNYIYSTLKGVWISGSGGAGNRVLVNRITAGAGSLAIDLDVAGPNVNNSSGSANNLQNYPVVLNAFRTSSAEWIQGSIDAAANTTYRLDYYWGYCCGGGPGTPARGIPNDYVGLASITTNVFGHAVLWKRLAAPNIGNQTLSLGLISATATASDGSTSEIGPFLRESTDMIFRDDFGP